MSSEISLVFVVVSLLWGVGSRARAGRGRPKAIDAIGFMRWVLPMPIIDLIFDFWCGSGEVYA